MQEIIVNIHNHTVLSDGSGNYYDIGQAALDAGIDVVITTDHNIYVSGKDAYYYRNLNRVLLLVGEEIHNPQNRFENHLLVLNEEKEMSQLCDDTQRLIDSSNRSGAITIIAHPYDIPLPLPGSHSFPWNKWEIHDFSGIELFNYLSELKKRSTNIFKIFYNILQPDIFALGADENALQKWDELLCRGVHLNGYAGSDAHCFRRKIGPIDISLFPYKTHFLSLNNHVYIPEKLSGNVEKDKNMIYDALRIGRSYIGYDMIYPTRGFIFMANGKKQTAWPGEKILLKESVTLQIKLPRKTICRLICNGKVVRQWENIETTPFTVTEPGYYRIEVYLPYKHHLRGWIYSNPIYVMNG